MVNVPSPLPSNTVTVLSPDWLLPVENAVPIEIAHHEETGRHTHSERRLRRECPVAVAQQHGHRIVAPLVTARSGMPSPLKSPTATNSGAVPTVSVDFVVKVPSPLPSNTVTVLLL